VENRIARYFDDQPKPIHALIARLGNMTAITRVWNPWEVDRCRLCPRCTVVENTCLVLIGGPVPKHMAPLFKIGERQGF
jgi:hypothetical protein